jgi:ATP-binding cassette subfamily B (MDR/TAP) protein 10
MPISTLVSAIGFTFSLVFATQGALQTFTDARHTLASLQRAQQVLSELPPDASMAAALAPGAWWDVANTVSQAAADGTCEILSESDAEEADVVSTRGSRSAQSSGSGIGQHGRAADAAQRGDLELRNVTFSYPSRLSVMVLKDLTLTLPRGRVTALVGRQAFCAIWSSLRAARFPVSNDMDVKAAGYSIAFVM